MIFGLLEKMSFSGPDPLPLVFVVATKHGCHGHCRGIILRIICIICSILFKAFQEAEDGTLGITLFHPVPVPPLRGAVADLGKDGFCLSIGHHICDVHGRSSGCGLYTYKTPWMMVPLSEDLRSKYSCRSFETPRGRRDPSVIASVMGWSRFRIVLCWM